MQNLSKTDFLFNDLNKKRKREFLLLDPTFDEERPGQYMYIALSLTVNLCATYEENRFDGSGSKSITMFDPHMQTYNKQSLIKACKIFVRLF